jgi:HD-GYP domain-containing protein (c-di-GMP phosphodiesterase class II)
MASNRSKVKSEALAVGMAVHEVTDFTSDYSYLDTTLLEFLRERFAGATCAIERKGQRLSVPVAGLQPLDTLRGITAIPANEELARLDADTIAALRKRGLREFVVSGGRAPPRSRAAARRQERVVAARVFLEKVGAGAEHRETAAEHVKELFSQGRAGKYTTAPAQQAVDGIVGQGLARAMGAVAGLRGSDQTYAHCVDTAVIFQEAYTDILRLQGNQVKPEAIRHTLLAGFCHDIGKSRVPREILDSTARFAPDSREMGIIRSHSAAGAQILAGLGMHKATVNVAHYHHVKLDTSLPSSYPEARWEEVLPITRLAAVVDVYQALIGKRSYKKNWVPGNAVGYLAGLRGKEFDPDMMDSFLRVIGRYPIGSLLRLSSGELAFVLAIDPEAPEQPVVAVVENAQGELMGQNTLIDLAHEPALSVAEVVDHYEHYNESEEQAFHLFASLNVA